MITALRTAWTDDTRAVDRNQNICAPVVTALFDFVYSFSECRYAHFANILAPSRLRKEVLANVAELTVYFTLCTT
jgi:hypothetical protein